MQAPVNNHHLLFLDGLRGLMALWVMVFHIKMTTTSIPTPWGSGALAVDIFMLISGFLMAYHWELRSTRYEFRDQVVDFYSRRFFRIAPLFYLLAAIVYLGHEYLFTLRWEIREQIPPPWMNPAEISGVEIPPVSPELILGRVLFIFGFIPEHLGTNMLPDWSIALEMQFYLVFPFLMLAIARFGRVAVCVVALLTAIATHLLIGLYQSEGPLGNFPQPSLLLFKINIFFAGMALALMFLTKSPRGKVLWGCLAALSLLNAAPQVWIAALLIGALLFFDPQSKSFLGRILSCSIARFLGDTSYAVYLVHFMVFIPIVGWLIKSDWWIGLDDTGRFLVALGLSAIPVYLISYVLYRLVERPGIQLGRKILAYKREAQKQEFADSCSTGNALSTLQGKPQQSS